MNAKEYLRRLYYLDCKIKEDKKRVARLKAQADKRTSNLSPDKVQTSGSQSRQADAICEWVDIERQIAEDEARMQEIISTIELLSPYESAVLYQCYRYDKSLGDITRDMPKRSYTWVARKHSEGIKNIQKILDERKARV